MEYTISEFTELIREYLYGLFPEENEQENLKRHSGRLGHIKDVAFKNNPTITLDENSLMFEIGNVYAEERYPYYHILQDTKYIHKRGMGTDRSKGSQAKVQDKGSRNYGKITWNGKTYSKEYSKNVRGSRDRTDKVSRWVNGKFVNREASEYLNIHYQYIDKILDYSLPFVAQYYGMKLMRKSNTGLEEDYNAQTSDEHETLLNMISEMMSSYEGEEDYD